MNARMFQQVRLWVYVILLILTAIRIWQGSAGAIDFILFSVVLALPYLELCPACGRLAWWETKAWPNALWIGRTCRAPISNEVNTVS